ncbi:transposable element Tcb1 transposase [Trichonephila clavipes]|nr:transposable element Tcb1 transposase [Trichonephila clavipes]
MPFYRRCSAYHGEAVVTELYKYQIVAGFITSSSLVPLKTRRVGQRCTLNLSRAETSSLWCGVVVRRGGGCQLKCRPRHLTMVQNYVVRHQKPSCWLWQRFQDDGNVSRCYSTGHPRVTTPNEDQYLAVTAKRSRRRTESDLSRQLSSATGTTVSRQTVYRRLGHIGLYTRRLVRCVPLTATHCRLRLTWSKEHALWTPQQWSCGSVSSFSLQSDSRRTLIWRAPGTLYHQDYTIERHRYGGAGWLVWGGNILGSRTDLHVQSVSMTGHIYRDVILEHVRLFRGTMGAEFLFMDENTHPHRANIVDECLQSDDITHMDWPAYSPDLNPIEHVWDMLGRRIAARQPPPTCLPELRRTLLDEWCNIPQD